jgi:hypothetical protein
MKTEAIKVHNFDWNIACKYGMINNKMTGDDPEHREEKR